MDLDSFSWLLLNDKRFFKVKLCFVGALQGWPIGVLPVPYWPSFLIVEYQALKCILDEEHLLGQDKVSEMKCILRKASLFQWCTTHVLILDIMDVDFSLQLRQIIEVVMKSLRITTENHDKEIFLQTKTMESHNTSLVHCICDGTIRAFHLCGIMINKYLELYSGTQHIQICPPLPTHQYLRVFTELHYKCFKVFFNCISKLIGYLKGIIHDEKTHWQYMTSQDGHKTVCHFMDEA